MVYTLIDSTSETGGTSAVNSEDPSLVCFFFVFWGRSVLIVKILHIFSILDGQMLSTSINGSL